MGSIPGSGRFPEEGMTTHSSVLPWRIPQTEEPGGLLSWGHRVRNDWRDWACTHLRVLWTHPILSFADTIPSLWYYSLLCPIYLTPIPSPGLMRISKTSLTSSLSKSRPASRVRTTECTLAFILVLMPLHHACHNSLLPPPTPRPSRPREDTLVAPVPYRPCARFTIQHVFAEGVNEQRGISRKDKEERCFHFRNHPTNGRCRACRSQAVSSAWG